MRKIQKIVIFYRRSPVKNDMLQKLVTDERGRELKLQKDCKTRWSSVVIMIWNFLVLKVQIYDDLSDRGMEHMFPREREIDHAKELTAALKIIAWATTKLGARDMNLAEADRIFEFALTELDKLGTNIADELRMSMFQRLFSRRQEDICTLLAFLENPRFLDKKSRKLSYSSKTRITDLAVSVYTRLFDNDPETMTDDTEDGI